MKTADRKKQLIAEGRIYRAELMIAKETVRANLQPDTLARNMLARAAVVAIALFRKRGGIGMPGLPLPTLLPLVINGAAALAKKKSLLKAALVAGTVAGMVALIAKMKQASADSMPDDDPSG